jgi:peptidyl-prolyl cis-trans isomerase B (cyclophilin B)
MIKQLNDNIPSLCYNVTVIKVERRTYMANELPIVTIETLHEENIIIELYPEIAPNSVNNFISLINKGYYDGLAFHRVIPGFMIQGGCPDGTGMGGPGYSIKGEFKGNGFPNPLKHTRGVLSMARSMNPNSAGSQFFLMVADSPHLDGQYAAFGKVISGLDVCDKIVAVKRDYNDMPQEPQIMVKVTVDTHGVDYPEPTKA